MGCPRGVRRDRSANNVQATAPLWEGFRRASLARVAAEAV
jgi:hypothetical protein